MHSYSIIQELRMGWRVVVPMVVAQILGAVLLATLDWPASVALMPELPAWVMQAWCGVVFAMPVGFLVGLAVQHRSGKRASTSLVWFCAAMSVLLPAVALVVVNS